MNRFQLEFSVFEEFLDKTGSSAADIVYASHDTPHWAGVMSLFFSKYHTSLLFIMHCITLHKQLVSGIGR